MANHEVKASVYSCDAPKCSVERVTRGDEDPKGFRGSVAAEDTRTVEFFACKSTHLRPAIEHVTSPEGFDYVEPVTDERNDTEREADEQAAKARVEQDVTGDEDLNAMSSDWSEGEDEPVVTTPGPFVEAH